jgi:hypothetical protein
MAKIPWNRTSERLPTPIGPDPFVKCLVWIDCRDIPEAYSELGVNGVAWVMDWDHNAGGWKTLSTDPEFQFLPVEYGPYWIAFHEIESPI